MKRLAPLVVQLPFSQTLLALALLSLAPVACRSETPPPAPLTTCTEPRPQICTRDYRPVCGQRTDGTQQTYGNPCGACADPRVVGHRPDACAGSEGD